MAELQLVRLPPGPIIESSDRSCRRLPQGRVISCRADGDRGLVVTQEVATSLWALATLRRKNVALLQALCQRVEDSVEYFNAVDLAQSVWALATLRYHPGPCLDVLALACKARLSSFQPKVHPPCPSCLMIFFPCRQSPAPRRCVVGLMKTMAKERK